MALINCSECGYEFSDKAPACPKCGCPNTPGGMTAITPPDAKSPTRRIKTRFDIAVELASGWTQLEGQPSLENSAEEGGVFVIRSAENTVLATVSTSDINQHDERVVTLTQQRVPALSEASRAVIWARSAGYRVPSEPPNVIFLLLTIVGLFLGVVPGLIVALLWWSQRGDYARRLRLLVAEWREAGKPEPVTQSRN